ncbi:inter-alpha-trypsin inhibitor heavy chain H4-like isoform X2 [Anoplophora glabripennis]|uniref:inter-alpha-trypsin inhibitor heavy chain H4-like isoform X2 n=1 Tax=Anoplophora glabripennis TaxID=217634 RepID=UPI000874FB35|nr:inter-alpha-trypsin inhibitor heavy chain H4-like isoform X2 [Anoplophora glabripennis]
MAEIELNWLTSALIRFSRCLHDKLKNRDGDDLFSFVSVHAFLTLLSQDPWFYSKIDIYRALSVYGNIASIHYKNIFDVLGSITDLVVANVSFLKPCQVVEAFRNRLVDNFASDVNFLDFTNPENATAAINAWFRDRTVQRITPLNGLGDDVKFTSLNAMRFKSNWSEPFCAKETAPATFYLNEQDTVQVPMMRKKGEFYFEYDSYIPAKILKLPFADNDVSLLVILPEKNIHITDFIQRFYMPGNLDRLTMNLTKRMVNVSLPKFKMEEEMELDQYLIELGLEDIFNAYLSGVIEDEDLMCNGVQQKVYLELNEEGLEAASGTVSALTKAHFEELSPKDGLKIQEASISTEVTNRFAKTKVVWRVNNTNKMAADANFKVVLTDLAFITEFVMDINGKSYKSYIKEKKEAWSIFKKAMALGQSAGLVEATTRDSKEFTVSVNLEPNSVAIFTLTYEEVLQRVHDQYELVLNICPGQIVEDLSIEVRIKESRPLKFVKTPPLRSGNDMSTSEFVQILDPLSDIKIINSKTAAVKFHPSTTRQRKMTHFLGNKTNDGLSGQFVVQYDVEREPLNGEILLQDGYFVHFFAPNDLNPLPKHVVFVLDTSGSMGGRKIEQLKDAMMNILSDLQKEDMLSIIEFNDNINVWDVDSKKSATVSQDEIKNFKNPFVSLKRCILADPHLASDDIIKNAKEIVQNIKINGFTFMIGGLETALYLVKMGQQKDKVKDRKLQPIIVFLTDGQPNVGIESTNQIIELVTHLNAKDKVPIFSLSFGDGTDEDFLRKLSLKNLGFSRHIYEANDASLQLQDFYKQISSPLLYDINFKYDSEVAEVTKTQFPIYFRGSELVVAGRYVEPKAKRSRTSFMSMPIACKMSAQCRLEMRGRHLCCGKLSTIVRAYGDIELDAEKKPTEEFTADRPFLIFLQVEKDGAVIPLFQGCVYKPSY